MAWAFARYIGHVAAAGKAVYPIPMNVNAALPRSNSILDVAKKGPVSATPRGLSPSAAHARRDRRVESGGPGHRHTFARYLRRRAVRGLVREVQPIRQPAVRTRDESNMEAKVMYAVGRHDAVGISLMGVERPAAGDPDMVRGYEMIAQLAR